MKPSRWKFWCHLVGHKWSYSNFRALDDDHWTICSRRGCHTLINNQGKTEPL